jgi:hypothetical protein
MKLGTRLPDERGLGVRDVGVRRPTTRAVWVRRACLALALAGCTGKIGTLATGAGGVGAGGVGASNGAAAAGAGGATTVGIDGGLTADCLSLTGRRVRRLAEREYSNVVLGLLGTAAQTATAAAWPDEATVGGFDNQDIALFVSATLQEVVADLAEQLAAAADPTTIAPCATAAGSTACLQSFITSFTLQAYGRPITTAENTEYLALAAQGQDYPTAVRLIVEMVLQSPYMLYVSELGDTPTASTTPVLLTPYEIASQISFLLAGTRPDATLLQIAQTTGFPNASVIQEQAARLLAAPAGQASLARYITGWWEMGPMASVPKSSTVYPLYTPAVAAAMQQEYDQFVTTTLNSGNGTLADFFTTTSSNIPAALAPIYGSDLLASGLLDTTHRKGMLSLPAVLTYNSNDINSGPVERGLLVRRQLLCQVVAPPPSSALAVIAANPFQLTANETTRQFFEMHAADPACSGCHNQFDLIGFGMEDMDGLGSFRTTENGSPVDSSGTLSGSDVDGDFTGPAQLSGMLANSQEAALCAVQHYFNFDQARDPTTADQCVLQSWANQLAQNGGHIADLVNASVADQDFIYRQDDR